MLAQSLVSKVLRVEDTIALVQDFVSLHSQMEILTKIAHIE
jgi:hypothetical protein